MVKKAYIGIDLHTDNFMACYLRKGEKPEHKIFKVSNDGFSEFRSTLSKNDRMAVESVINTAHFCKQVKKYVQKIEIVAPGQFFIISQSVKKTDKNDAEALAFYLSKNMLPTARLKSKAHSDIASLVDMRTQLVKMRKSIINKTHSILHRNGIKVDRSRLLTKSGFSKYVFPHDWDSVTQFELDLIHDQVKSLNENITLATTLFFLFNRSPREAAAMALTAHQFAVPSEYPADAPSTPTPRRLSMRLLNMARTTPARIAPHDTLCTWRACLPPC